MFTSLGDGTHRKKQAGVHRKGDDEVQVDEILSWASRFDDASYEAKHLVIAQLVEWIEIRKKRRLRYYYSLAHDSRAVPWEKDGSQRLID